MTDGTREFTRLERGIDRLAHRILRDAPRRGARAVLVECAVFLLKQAWACVFGALLLAVIVAARLWYPEDAVLARNDALTISAIVIQIGMLAFRLESGRELWVIVLFHITGTVMELFKTDVGSWSYDGDGVLRIGAVPLFSGFMYAAVGSYMVRVYRLHDLRFARYPRVWLTAIVAALIYLNFFGHHFVFDFRWILLAAVVVLWLPTVMHFRVWRTTLRVPILPVFVGVALFIWFAENIGTWAGAWFYPNQTDGWHLVSPQKIVAWFLLMIISIVLVTFVYPPKPPEVDRADRTDAGDAERPAPEGERAVD